MTELACSKRDTAGKLCTNTAVPGDDKCSDHKGKPGRLNRKRNNLAEHYIGNGPIKDINVVKRAQGDNEDDFLGQPVDIDPAEALLEEIRMSYGHVLWLRRKVQSLGGNDLVWGTTLEVEEDSYGDDGRNYKINRTEKKAEINKWWELYEKERKHLAQVSAAAVRADIETRRITMEERRVDALEAAIVAAMLDMGVDPYTARARQAIGNRLREALSGQPLVIEGQLTQAALAPVEDHTDSAYWSTPEPEDF